MISNLAQAIARLSAAARAFDVSRFLPLHAAGVQVGWVRRDHAERLKAWPDVFQETAGGLMLASDLADSESRSAALALVVRALAEQGVITGWRDEQYAVMEEFGKPPLFHIERAAARFLGVTTFAAHMNGYVGSGQTCRMWLARRSATKPIDPGMLDNLVGGGIPAGASVRETLVKEGREEAGISPELMATAVATGSVRILRAVPEGAQSEIIFVYDLELPPDFQPRNEDGEVAEFNLTRIDEVAKLIELGSEMTLDSSLVIMKFLMTRTPALEE